MKDPYKKEFWMKIKGILSERKHWDWRSAQIVTEWEDIISDKLNLPIYNVKRIYDSILWRINKFKLVRLFLFIDSLRPVRNYYLYFNMSAKTEVQITSVKNIIPVIIDFWLTVSELENFYKVHSNCKLMLISSKEVFEFLQNNNCPFPIAHFPVSLPDKYISPDISKYKKTIDFLFAGRKDPVFWDYIKKYEKENPVIEYVYQELYGRIPYYVSNKKGKLEGDYFSREAYSNLLRSAKITFYSTPGTDPSKVGSSGYNQVTPRFLELLSSGCLVMGRYTDNPDVEFYQLPELCFRISSYQDFERYARLFLDNDFVKEHLSRYPSYLTKHSTSSRIDLLEKILKENSFNYSKI